VRPPLDERRLKLAELIPYAKQLDPRELVELARPGQRGDRDRYAGRQAGRNIRT